MAFTFLPISSVGGLSMEAICGGSLFDDEQVDPDTQFPSQKLSYTDHNVVKYPGILCRFSEFQTGQRQSQDDDNFFSPRPVLSTNGTGVLPADKAAYENTLSEKDINWKRTEINRKFTVLVDN